jgi:hypothetical protein
MRKYFVCMEYQRPIHVVRCKSRAAFYLKDFMYGKHLNVEILYEKKHVDRALFEECSFHQKIFKASAHSTGIQKRDGTVFGIVENSRNYRQYCVL